MNFLNTLFNGTEGVWSGGIAHSIIILALVIALGKIMGKIKIAGISCEQVLTDFEKTISGNLGI